jgi:hypothetical protein
MIVTSLLFDHHEVAAEMFPAIVTHNKYAIKWREITKVTFRENE